MQPIFNLKHMKRKKRKSRRKYFKKSYKKKYKKAILFLLLSGLFVLIAICIIAFITYNSRIISEYHTIGHSFLDLEKENGLYVQTEHYKLLDNLINLSIDEIGRLYGINQLNKEDTLKIIRENIYSENDAEMIFKSIDTLLTKNNFVHRINYFLKDVFTSQKLDTDIINIIKNNQINSEIIIKEYDTKNIRAAKIFFNENLEKMDYISKNLEAEYHFANCHNMAIIYLSIADALNLPVYAVQAPNHTFIRWYMGENNYFNWETTSSKHYTDEQYMDSMGITGNISVIKAGVYFRSLTRKETFVIQYDNLGFYWFWKAQTIYKEANIDKAVKYYKKAVDFFTMGINANNHYPVCFNNRGVANEKIGQILSRIGNYNVAFMYYDYAINDFNSALQLNPENNEFMVNIDHALMDLMKITINDIK